MKGCSTYRERQDSDAKVHGEKGMAMIDTGHAERQRGKIGRIGVRILSTLRSRKWLLNWLSFYLWAALFLGLLHLTPLHPRATLEKTHLGLFSPDASTLV